MSSRYNLAMSSISPMPVQISPAFTAVVTAHLTTGLGREQHAQHALFSIHASCKLAHAHHTHDLGVKTPDCGIGLPVHWDDYPHL